MPEQLRWGIIATGSIAHQFAEGLQLSKTGTLQAVGSRDFAKAQTFATRFGGTAYGSYEEVLTDPEVDVVYIATPHHMHAEWTIKCAEAGKGILCEKPFTLNAKEAEEALAAVDKAGVFFMEAFMYRCSPQMLLVRDLISEGAIGEVVQVNAEFGYGAGEEWDHFKANAEFGGGGLMDVGCYCVSFARMCFGEEPGACSYSAQTPKGYDASGAGVLTFSKGRTAHFGTGVHVSLKNDARVYGTKGSIYLNEPWKSNGATVTVNGEERNVAISNAELYMHEADAVAQFFNQSECPYVTKADTMAQMRTLDKLRASAGITFGVEKK